MIEAAQLSKVYGKRTVVKNISFKCNPGRVCGLIGPNGSGKSTTMKMLLGITKPTNGNATIKGKPYEKLTPYPLVHVGALLDNVSPVPERTALAHLHWIAKANGIPKDRVEHILNFVGLQDARKKKFGAFSLGMKQRLGLGVALLGDPDVLILDEPMNGLDPDGIRWMRNVILSAAEEGKTVLVSSHFMNELEEVVDDVVIIESGSLVTSGTLQDVRGRHQSLEDAYFSLLEETYDSN